MSSNAPASNSPNCISPTVYSESQASSDALQADQRWPPTAQKWDEENCEPQLLLDRLGKVLREKDGNLPAVSGSISFASEKQSHRPIREGLRISSSIQSYRG